MATTMKKMFGLPWQFVYAVWMALHWRFIGLPRHDRQWAQRISIRQPLLLISDDSIAEGYEDLNQPPGKRTWARKIGREIIFSGMNQRDEEILNWIGIKFGWGEFRFALRRAAALYEANLPGDPSWAEIGDYYLSCHPEEFSPAGGNSSSLRLEVVLKKKTG